MKKWVDVHFQSHSWNWNLGRVEKYGAMVVFFKWLYEKGIFDKSMANLKLIFQNILHWKTFSNLSHFSSHWKVSLKEILQQFSYQ